MNSRDALAVTEPASAGSPGASGVDLGRGACCWPGAALSPRTAAKVHYVNRMFLRVSQEGATELSGIKTRCLWRSGLSLPFSLLFLALGLSQSLHLQFSPHQGVPSTPSVIVKQQPAGTPAAPAPGCSSRTGTPVSLHLQTLRLPPQTLLHHPFVPSRPPASVIWTEALQCARERTRRRMCRG